MRFEPKLVPLDDPPQTTDGELALPPDLAALGAQLAGDARQLALIYPSSAAPTAVVPVSGAKASRLFLHAIAAACVLVAVALIGRQSRLLLESNPTVPPAAVAGGQVAQSPQASEAPWQSPRDRTFASQRSALPLFELSGPELEALVDLAAPEPATNIRISF